MSNYIPSSPLGKRRRYDDDDSGREYSPGLFMTPGPASGRLTPFRTWPTHGIQPNTSQQTSVPDSPSPASSLTPLTFSPAATSDSAIDVDEMKEKTNLHHDEQDEEDLEDDTDDEFYNQAHEKLPDHPAYHPRLPGLKQSVINLVSEFTVHLKPYLDVSDDIANLASKAKDAIQHPEVKKPTIMLLGATGTGKSSTGNSFVDDLTVSKAVADGESVTCVPMLVTSAEGDTYTAEVRFLCRNVCEDFLRQQLTHYIRWEFKQAVRWDEEERKEFRALHATALKILRAPFCEYFEFDSPGSIRDFIESRRDTTIETLMNWYDEIFQDDERDNDRPIRKFEAVTSDKLNEEIEDHIYQNSNFDKTALWPLVEYVRKGIPNSRVLKHVNLLDAPGTADQDRVRAAIALKLTQQCDALWIVSSIKRVVSDADVDHNLATYGERFSKNTVVIATGSDANLNPALARDLQLKKQSVDAYWELQERITELKRLKVASKKLRRVRPGGTGRSKDDIEAELEEVQNEQFDGLVAARNSFVQRSFRDSKRGHFPDVEKVPVFCVSNTHYANWKGEDSGDRRQMSVEATNIPALRAHALRLAAPAEFRAANIFVTRAVTLLKGAAYWIDKTGHEHHDALMQLVKAPGELLASSMELHITDAMKKFDTGVVQPLLKKRSTFVAAALQYAETIYGLHFSSLRAFFRKDGRHAPAGQTFQIWNERFTDVQTNETLNPSWERAMAAYRGSLDGLVNKIVNQLVDLPDSLSRMMESVTVDVGRLDQLLQGHVNRIHNAHQHRLQEMEKFFSNIKLNASRDIADGYYNQAMKQMYDEGKRDSGRGVQSRLHGLLQDTLEDDSASSPVAAVPNGIQTHSCAAVQTTARYLEADIKAILNEMTLQFDAILKTNLQTPDEAAARAALRPFLRDALVKAEAIERELAEIRGAGPEDGE